MEAAGALSILIIVAVVWLLPAFIAGRVADRKGRSALGWGLCGLGFSWLGVIFAALASPSIEHQLRQEQLFRRRMRDFEDD
ncbi:MAG: hypothetical protein F4W99_06620 [Chloroflexi bacterium]|nr:hypothetical protein [Chloroflexota bacterium]